MPGCIVSHGANKYLYYVGWNVSSTVPYRNSIGLAITKDDGETFERIYQGPIMDRTAVEPFLCATPFVLIENGIWRMWYLSGVGWEMHDNRAEPLYNIRYAESDDGIEWRRMKRVCIDFKTPSEGGLASPCVIPSRSGYQMWYCYRNRANYRTETSSAYRIGYAESPDGLTWTRRDEVAGIDVSESGWDSEMTAYPHVFQHDGRLMLLYNGNGFGRSGFGLAISHLM
jgi:hypothetical protein